MEALMQYADGDDSPGLLLRPTTHIHANIATTSGRPPAPLNPEIADLLHPVSGGTEPPSQENSQKTETFQKAEKHDIEAEEDEEEDEDLAFRLSLPTKSAAPPVSDALLLVSTNTTGTSIMPRQPLDPSIHSVKYNPTYDQLWAPVAGPAHPFMKDGLSAGSKNHKQGSVEDSALNPFNFDEQYHTFQAYGTAVDPASSAGEGVVGEASLAGSATVFNLPQKAKTLIRKQRKENEALNPAPGPALVQREGEKSGTAEGDESGGGKRRMAGEEGDKEEEDKEEEEDVEKEEEDEEEEGGSALNPASSKWLELNKASPWAGGEGRKKRPPAELTEEQKKYAEEHAEKKAKKESRGSGAAPEPLEAKSTFHGKEERDYQGRSWLEAPRDVKANNEHCYIPKKWVHTWSGHTKGVSCIRFFPGSGHLLLSASMDSKLKIWEVPRSDGSGGSGKCMRTYLGHTKAVRDATFTNDGKKFLSCGYDRSIVLWDTETGKSVGKFSTGKVPYVVRFNPDEDKQDTFLAGMSDKKIMQWDARSGEVTQEYDQHLGAVNTITFVDDNRRFVTSSDDKSLRVWEFGIPVVIKYISEPHMHSMPAIALHPNKNWLACQSLDNQVLIYSTRDRFRLNKKKRFAGHIIAGYACQVSFSPDGRFLTSGDGEGRCWFWDWKSSKVFRTLKCHDSVCIGVDWHPLEQSKVATCGWDGLIKYWD